jgi:hypothetical protein
MHCDGKWKSRSHNTSYCSIGHRLSKRYFCKQTIFNLPGATCCTHVHTTSSNWYKVYTSFWETCNKCVCTVPYITVADNINTMSFVSSWIRDELISRINKMHCDGKWKSRSHNTSYCSIGHRLSKRYFCKQTIFNLPGATCCTHRQQRLTTFFSRNEVYIKKIKYGNAHVKNPLISWRCMRYSVYIFHCSLGRSYKTGLTVLVHTTSSNWYKVYTSFWEMCNKCLCTVPCSTVADNINTMSFVSSWIGDELIIRITGNENQDHTIQVIAQSVTVYQSVISVNRLYLIFPALLVVRTDNKD